MERAMLKTRKASTAYTEWLLVAGAAVGLIVAIVDYFLNPGIDHTPGALLVIISTALVTLAGLVLALVVAMPRWPRVFLDVAILLGVLGTGFAAWLLEADILLALMAVSLIGWFLHILLDRREGERLSVRATGNRPGDLLGVAAFLAVMGSAVMTAHAAGGEGQTWYTFNGDLGAQKYAAQSQITPANVHALTTAWQLHTGDFSTGKGGVPASDWSATPLFVNDTIYVSTPFYRVFAVAPDTGAVKWVFDPHAVLKPLTQPDMKTRGVAYWESPTPQPNTPCQKIIYDGTMDAKLYAIDADSGKPCTGFGKDGVLDVNQWNVVDAKWPLSLLQPPTVYKDTLFIGWAGMDWVYQSAPPGTVFAVDAQTGKLNWTFSAIPAEYAKTTGTANVWASMSVDPKAGLLYLPVSSPSPNFYGGDRKEPLPLVTSVTAVNVDTGKVVWSRQLVHHDLWDYDTNSAPVLVDLHKDGQTIPALVQSSKQGYLFVLNRLTGEPIYPIEEKSVPRSNVPGEQSSPTQPSAGMPRPVVNAEWPGISKLADIASGGYCSRTFSRLRYDGKFTPPSLEAGTLVYPATAGGVEWGGGAVDPATRTYVVNNSSTAMIYRLIKRDEYESELKQGDPLKFFRMEGSPYGMYLSTFVNFLGMPCWKPPYGSLSAYDLDTGQLLWRRPFGEVQKWGFYMPRSWGSVTIGGPVITQTGVIFLGGSMDSRVRAIDLKTGDELWQAQVDAPAVSIPAVFTYKGKEYVVFAAGGNTILMPKVGDQLIAFALPK
jgi:quinoprotein glucose dehydrogenase